MSQVFRYAFGPEVRMEEVEAVLALAVSVTETLFGEAAVRLEVGYALDADRRTCVLNADTAAARDCNRIFIGLLGRELGPDAFGVEHRASAGPQQPREVPAGVA